MALGNIGEEALQPNVEDEEANGGHSWEIGAQDRGMAATTVLGDSRD